MEKIKALFTYYKETKDYVVLIEKLNKEFKTKFTLDGIGETLAFFFDSNFEDSIFEDSFEDCGEDCPNDHIDDIESIFLEVIYNELAEDIIHNYDYRDLWVCPDPEDYEKKLPGAIRSFIKVLEKHKQRLLEFCPKARTRRRKKKQKTTH